MTENKETGGYISGNEDLAARAWRQGGRGDGAQASDRSLSFLRKHRRSNRFGGVRTLNKYSLTGRGLLFGNQVEGINERLPWTLCEPTGVCSPRPSRRAQSL